MKPTLFGPILQSIEQLSGHKYESGTSPVDFAFRVVAEHTRSMVFCIADGIQPGNEGRDYVLRYIMRRAIRYGKTILGFEEPFLHLVAPMIIEQMGGFYTELPERRDLILSTIQDEEKRFRRTLDNGLRILNQMLDSGTVQETKVLPGHDVFNLYSTYGFPLSLTIDIARERGIMVDEAGYQQASIEFSGPKKEKGDVFTDTHILGADMPPTIFWNHAETGTSSVVIGMYQNETSVENRAGGR